jgi:hypothetical protein
MSSLDIDGDGRADYCLINTNEDMMCWRNGGWGDVPTDWKEMTGSNIPTFPGQNKGGKDGVILGEYQSNQYLY